MNIKKRVYGFMLLLVIPVFLIFGFIFVSFLQLGKYYVTKPIGDGYVSFNHAQSSNEIFLQNGTLISNDIGGVLNNSSSNKYFDFDISSVMSNIDNVDYEIYLTRVKLKNEIDERYIKVYLVDAQTNQPIDGYEKEVPSYANLKDSVTTKNSKQLYQGKFISNGIQQFKLRLWIANNYVGLNKKDAFKVKVNVKTIK